MNAVEAIKFAITIDDHFDRLQFLEDWMVGDYWPEFKEFLKVGEKS